MKNRILKSVAAIMAICAATIAYAQSSNLAPVTQMSSELEMSPYLPLGQESLCRLDWQGEQILGNLLIYDENTPAFIGKDAFPLPNGEKITPVIEREFSRHTLETTTVATVNLPKGVSWYGLPLARVNTGILQRDESDGYEWREFTIGMPAVKVRQTLRSIGEDVPISPLYRIIEAEDRCSGTAYLEDKGSSSVLHCGWGC